MTNDELLTAATTLWPQALAAALHPDLREVRKDAPEGKQSVHPSDPPHNFNPYVHHAKRPGPLPPHRAALPPIMAQEKHTGRFRVAEIADPTTLRMGLEGQARHWVVEARRKQATAVAPGEVRLERANGEDILVVEASFAFGRLADVEKP